MPDRSCVGIHPVWYRLLTLVDLMLTHFSVTRGVLQPNLTPKQKLNCYIFHCTMNVIQKLFHEAKIRWNMTKWCTCIWSSFHGALTEMKLFLHLICWLQLCSSHCRYSTTGCAFVSAGNVCLYACSKGNAVWDPWPRKSQTSHTLGAAGLRGAIHFIEKVFHHFPDHSVRIRQGARSTLVWSDETFLLSSLMDSSVLLRRYFLASFYTKYDTAHFVINTASLLSVLIPKLPQLHGVRLFGINKY